MNIVRAIEIVLDQGYEFIDEDSSKQSDIDSWNKAIDTIMDRCGVVLNEKQDRFVENEMSEDKKEYDNTPVVSQQPPGSLLKELGYKNPDGTMKEPVSEKEKDDE